MSTNHTFRVTGLGMCISSPRLTKTPIGESVTIGTFSGRKVTDRSLKFFASGARSRGEEMHTPISVSPTSVIRAQKGRIGAPGLEGVQTEMEISGLPGDRFVLKVPFQNGHLPLDNVSLESRYPNCVTRRMKVEQPQPWRLCNDGLGRSRGLSPFASSQSEREEIERVLESSKGEAKR